MCEPYNDISGGNSYTYSTLPIVGFNATVVDTQVGFDFPFKPFFSGAGIQIDEITNPGAITITYTGAPGAPYTYSTEIAGDATVVGTQIGTNFGFKPINGGINVDVTEVLGAVVIDGPTYASNIVIGSDVDITAAQVGNQFRFKPLNAGTNVTIEETTLPGAITINSIAPPPSQLFQNRTLFVDQQYGNDATGVRERRDLPYQTMAGAYADAIGGDTIHVFPGNYIEALVVSLPNMKFYLENGVTINSSNAPIFTFIDTLQEYDVSGHGYLITDLVNGGIISIPNGGVGVTLKASRILVNGAATAFRVTNCPLDVDVPQVLSNNALCRLFDITSSPSIRLTSNYLIWAGDLYNITGTTNLMIDVDLLRNVRSSTSCRSNSDNVIVQIKANEMVTEGASYINIIDPSAIPTNRSNIDISIVANSLSTNIAPFVLMTSTRNVGLYPRFHLNVNDSIHTNLNFSLYSSNRGEMYINANSTIVNSSNSTSAYAIMSPGTFYLSSNYFEYNTASLVAINASNVHITSDDFRWTGLITGNGRINCKTMTGTSICQFSAGGLANTLIINADILNMTNTTLPLISSSLNGLLTILSNSITLNTGSSNYAIQSSANLQINTNSLNFTFTSSHPTVFISSNLNNVITANTINNMCINVAPNAKANVSAKFMSNSTTAGAFIVLNEGILTMSVDRLEISATNLMFLSAGIGAVCNLTANTITYTSSSGIPTPILFNSLSNGSFNAIIQTINYAPSIPGNLISNSSTTAISNFNIGSLITSGSMLDVIILTGSSNTIMDIGYANITTNLLNMSSTGTNILKCNAFGVTTLITVNVSPALFEIAGSYSTTSTSVITGAIPTRIGLNSVRLLSSGTCINGPFALSVVPSSARFAATVGLIIPAGTLFIDPLL